MIRITSKHGECEPRKINVQLAGLFYKLRVETKIFDEDSARRIRKVPNAQKGPEPMTFRLLLCY